jgi:tetratricopeptide (TPR) repeat protein
MPTLSEELATGLQHHHAGHLAQAEATYRKILGIDPTCADAWNLMGVLATQTGHYEHAVTLIKKALELWPDSAVFHFNLALALQHQGRLEESVAIYHRVLNDNPNHVQALGNMGNALQELGRPDEAFSYLLLARDLNPNAADVHFNLGNNFKIQKKWGDAIACYHQALKLNPTWGEAHSNLGDALLGRGDTTLAIASYRRALEFLPNSAEVFSNLGSALADQGESDQAMECFRLAIKRMPELSIAHLNLGSALQRQGRADEALPALYEALRLNPMSATAYNVLGLALRDLGRFDEARDNFEKSLERDPDFPSAHTNYGMMLLSNGDFVRGWTEYEWRWKTRDLIPRLFEKPSWNGDALDGKTILLYAEQGLGDTLQFIRYASLVEAQGGRVIVECQWPLLKILARCPSIARLIAQGETLPSFDVHAPLLSLPRLLKTTLETVPVNAPYLFADKQLVDEWRHRLKNVKQFRIGINWRGRTGQGVFRQRDISPLVFTALADLPVQLVSLQKEATPSEILDLAECPVYVPNADFDQNHGAFMDTAAVMMNLDLILTSDTSVPHLAGALGVPVWVALPYVASWQWMRTGSNNAWYPTARVFRQNRPGDWEHVFDAIRCALRQMLME